MVIKKVMRSIFYGTTFFYLGCTLGFCSEDQTLTSLNAYQKPDSSWTSKSIDDYDTEALRSLFNDPAKYRGYYDYLLSRAPRVRQKSWDKGVQPLAELDPKLEAADDLWVKILLKCCTTSPLDDHFATLQDGSNSESGVFFLSPQTTSHFDNLYFDPGHAYFSWINPFTKERRYRLYSLGSESDQEISCLPHSSTIKYYSLGYRQFESQLSPKTSNGFLLNREEKLIQEPGFFLVYGKEDNFDCYLYDYSPDLQSMALYLMEDSCKESAPHLEYLLEGAGGKERLKAEGALFLPHEKAQQSLTLKQAKILLPYLYLLEQQLEETPDPEIDQHALATVIEKAETLVKEEIAPKILPLLENQVRKEMTDQQSNQEPLNQGSAPKTKPHQKSKGKQTKIRETSLKKEQKVDEDEVKKQANIRFLERMRKKFLGEVSEQHRYNTKEAGEVFKQVADTFHRVGIEKTGESTTRGSHVALEMLTKEGNAFYVGLVKRSEYRVGTLKAAINSAFDQALKALF